jgi:hypothetical protein
VPLCWLQIALTQAALPLLHLQHHIMRCAVHECAAHRGPAICHDTHNAGAAVPRKACSDASLGSKHTLSATHMRYLAEYGTGITLKARQTKVQ